MYVDVGGVLVTTSVGCSQLFVCVCVLVHMSKLDPIIDNRFDYRNCIATRNSDWVAHPRLSSLASQPVRTLSFDWRGHGGTCTQTSTQSYSFSLSLPLSLSISLSPSHHCQEYCFIQWLPRHKSTLTSCFSYENKKEDSFGINSWTPQIVQSICRSLQTPLFTLCIHLST